MYFKKNEKQIPLLEKVNDHPDRYAFYKDKATSKDFIDVEVFLKDNPNVKYIILIKQT